MLSADEDTRWQRDTPIAKGADCCGDTALLLVESLIHELIQRKCLTVAHAISVIDSAASVQIQLHEDRGGAETPDPAYRLHMISASLATELL